MELTHGCVRLVGSLISSPISSGAIDANIGPLVDLRFSGDLLGLFGSWFSTLKAPLKLANKHVRRKVLLGCQATSRSSGRLFFCERIFYTALSLHLIYLCLSVIKEIPNRLELLDPRSTRCSSNRIIFLKLRDYQPGRRLCQASVQTGLIPPLKLGTAVRLTDVAVGQTGTSVHPIRST